MGPDDLKVASGTKRQQMPVPCHVTVNDTLSGDCFPCDANAAEEELDITSSDTSCAKGELLCPPV